MLADGRWTKLRGQCTHQLKLYQRFKVHLLYEWSTPRSGSYSTLLWHLIFNLPCSLAWLNRCMESQVVGMVSRTSACHSMSVLSRAVSFACPDALIPSYSKYTASLKKMIPLFNWFMTFSFIQVLSLLCNFKNAAIAWNWLCYQSNTNSSFESPGSSTQILEAIRWELFSEACTTSLFKDSIHFFFKCIFFHKKVVTVMFMYWVEPPLLLVSFSTLTINWSISIWWPGMEEKWSTIWNFAP